MIAFFWVFEFIFRIMAAVFIESIRLAYETACFLLTTANSGVSGLCVYMRAKQKRRGISS